MAATYSPGAAVLLRFLHFGRSSHYGLNSLLRVGATCQVVAANPSSKHMGLLQPSSLQLLCLPFSAQWEAKDVNGMAPA